MLAINRSVSGRAILFTRLSWTFKKAMDRDIGRWHSMFLCGTGSQRSFCKKPYHRTKKSCGGPQFFGPSMLPSHIDLAAFSGTIGGPIAFILPCPPIAPLLVVVPPVSRAVQVGRPPSIASSCRAWLQWWDERREHFLTWATSLTMARLLLIGKSLNTFSVLGMKYWKKNDAIMMPIFSTG